MPRSMGNSASLGQNQVFMFDTAFSRREIRVKLGQSITLFARDAHTSYNIVSGTWEGPNLRLFEVSGTPEIGEGQVVGKRLRIIIGRCNEAGCFEFCDKDRKNMNLTVYVDVE